MMRCTAARLRVLVSTLVVFCAQPALAEDPTCSPMAIEADASARAWWPGLVDRVHEAFDARDDIDTCARIELRSSDASVIVEVVLASAAASDPSADFRRAMDALDRGDNHEAATHFAAFRAQHPRDPRAEDAAYLRVIALQRSGDTDQMKEAALAYLRLYPAGFRNAEVEKLAR
jgi:TolA-binding protein